jgi:hypothetical protein
VSALASDWENNLNDGDFVMLCSEVYLVVKVTIFTKTTPVVTASIGKTRSESGEMGG